MINIYSGYYKAIGIWLLIISIQSIAFAQTKCDYVPPKMANNWIFGEDAGINFNNPDNPELVPNTYFGDNTYSAFSGVSSISDENGELLFYSNGMHIWNKNAVVMDNGSGLLGNNSSTMTSIIVPSPANNKQYFVFTLDMYIPRLFNNGINYNIVDVSNNPLGRITEKNKPVLSENAQKICVVQHTNGKDYWIITHGFGPNNGNKFFVNLLTDSLNLETVSFEIGNPQTFDPTNVITYNNGVGYLKASPDGTKLAQVVYVDGYLEIFDFDKTTGTISNAKLSQKNFLDGPYGVEFSPQGTVLYVSTEPLGDRTSYIYQFDLTQSDPFSSQFEVTKLDFSTNNDILFGALQLAPDGKIYVSKFLKGSNGYNNLGVIYNPNRLGQACNYNSLNGMSPVEFNLGSGNSLSGLPTFPNNFLNIPHFSFFNKCHHDTTDFQIRNTANVDADWNFTTIDPNGSFVYSDPLNPGYVFSEPGVYKVELGESWNGTRVPYTDSITIHPLPNVDIGNGGDTISILPNSSVRLDAGVYDYYTWSPDGSHDRYLDVATEGWYSVFVTDTNCCSNTDSVYIQFAELSFPTAFKPSSSVTINQEFGVIGDVSSLAQYVFRVYDRWGMLLYETKNPREKWNGTFAGGEPAPQGVYVWHSVFTTFESSLQAARDIENRGTVMLLR
ncbi:MAG: gliding motility-associated C-terminal domain-containing protein [Bacteroidales bacterium]|jgi:hypothetical protein